MHDFCWITDLLHPLGCLKSFTVRLRDKVLIHTAPFSPTIHKPKYPIFYMNAFFRPSSYIHNGPPDMVLTHIYKQQLAL